jgi:crotonobetainyl-CoA:carnitine CoA-transferase CaiB-like acyl-CoA transferase
MLADMGANVIKVEQPGTGDMSREPSVSVNGESYYFMSLNRNKKGITLDLKHPKGLEIVKRLIAMSDVLVENFRPGVMAKMGLDYKSVKEENPKIIYASISGFGQDSPLAQRPAFDLIAQAMGGIMSVNGHPGGPPTRIGVSLGDTSAALYTAFAIMVALFNREQCGQGQHIDVAMVDSVFSLLEISLFQYLGSGETPGRIGSRHPTSYPYDSFVAGDGNHFAVATFSNVLFERLCEAMEMPELIQRTEFSSDTLRGRAENSSELKIIIEKWASAFTATEVLEKLEQHGVPVSPINSIEDVCKSEYARERGLLAGIDHPVAGKVKLPTLPVKFSSTPASIEAPSPLLGQHNHNVLSELLHYTDRDIENLKKQRVI